MSDQNPKNSRKILKAVLAIVLAIVMIFDTVVAVCASVYYFSGGKYFDATKKNGQGENNITIADEYVIKSTTNISDAYKSGKTSGLNEKDQETLKMASEVLDEIITEDMTDYDKEKAVFDWMTENIKNENVTLLINEDALEPDTPYGALKNHYAVCVGYATTFRMFMQMLDIDCMVVHNSEMYHSWDEVNLDGNWYYVDCYSAMSGHKYTFFNMNDDMLSQNGETWDKDYFPAATSLELNPLYQKRVVVDSIYDLPKLLKKDMKKNADSRIVEFKTPLNEKQYAQVDAMMNYLMQMVDTYSNYDTEPSTWTPLDSDNSGVKSIVIGYYTNDYDEDENDEYSTDMNNTMANAVDKQFDTSSLDESEMEEIYG